MIKRLLIFSVLFLLIVPMLACKEPDSIDEVTFNGRKYKLSFSDEFDTWDTSIWSKCPQMQRQDVGGLLSHSLLRRFLIVSLRICSLHQRY